MRTHAPIVENTLPIWNERIAATTVNQMNARTNSTSRSVAEPRIFGPGSALPPLKNSSNAVSASSASVPPVQIGFEIQ